MRQRNVLNIKKKLENKILREIEIDIRDNKKLFECIQKNGHKSDVQNRKRRLGKVYRSLYTGSEMSDKMER